MADRAALADYSATVASPALAALQPPAAALPKRAPRSWTVPTELAIAVTSSVWGKVIRNRRRKGPHAKPLCMVMRIDGRLYANVAFYGEASDLFFPLDQVELWENR